jgi:hypothetical protein
MATISDTLSPIDRAEAALALALRLLGVARMQAMRLAEAHSDRLLIEPSGAWRARLASGAVVPGDRGIQQLAEELAADG